MLVTACSALVFPITDEQIKEQSPNYEARKFQEEEEEKVELLRIEAESKHQRDLWEWHEELYKQRLAEKAAQEEREREQKLEIEVKHKNS